ncbi:integrase [Streptomyces sp. AV19]|uniref:integrase n=1 Tax=Streptomyces sp. AV19 TaxID=2793068 RepID=UPI0018FECCAF|nr:integrase [Streptomyces sp. AV19]MBH1934103.1 integrase [Streptomyces sp. AV19]MDG4537175.1 integrase [Streptomyces sp. AV19]
MSTTDTPPPTAEAPAVGGALDVEPLDGPAVPAARSGLSDAAREAVAAGVPEETARGYDGDWRRFTAWALALGRSPKPCTGDTLTEYVTWLTLTPRPRTGRPYKPASIDRAMASIAVAHQAAELPPPHQKGARLVLRGYERRLKETKDPRGRRRKATAATPPVLRKMVGALDRTTPIGIRDAAALLTGFALAARRGEAALLNWEDLTEVEEGFEAELYRPKVNKEQPPGVPYGSNPATCPVRALRAWRTCLTAHGRTPTGPLFVRIDRHGRIAHPMTRHGRPIGDADGRMTGEGIGDIVTRAATRAGLTPPADLLPDLPARWTGHSLRRGFATAARKAGKDMIETARHGGWVDGSKALTSYFEEAGRWDESNPLYGIGL